MLPIHINKHMSSSITKHLIELDADSKHLRFGYIPSEEVITSYVENSFKDVDNSVWFGYIDKIKCVGAIHIAITNDIAELGISVSDEYRGQKLSSQLFDRALEYLKSRNIKKVYMQCLSENTIIQYLARKFDMKVTNIGQGEKEANAELEVSNQVIHKVSNFTNECLGLVDSCIRHNIWLCTSLNSIFNLSYFYKE